MLRKIKNDLQSYQGKRVRIVVDIGRNKSEDYTGFIDKLYDNVWTIKTESGIKCFSYKDVLIKTIKIKPF